MNLSSLPLLPALLALPLAGCLSAEASLRQALEEANRCEEASDCMWIGSKCPFGCEIYVHKDEAETMKTLVDGFDSTCVYGCIQTFGVDCVEKQCQPILEPPADNASSASSVDPLATGNVGAACTSHAECETPMSYLIRSNCPYGSKCIDDHCAVVCTLPSPVPEEGWTKPLACLDDGDCDCSPYGPADVIRCSCIDKQCVAVVEE
jgi:hypothetical protein